MPKGVYIRTPENIKNLHPSSRKGIRLTDEHKRKIGLKSIGNKYLLGKKLSVSHKRKISEKLKGKIPKNLSEIHSLSRTDEWRRKIGKSNSKEKSHWWKGGITKKNFAIRMSLEYKLWREAVFKRDNYKCIWGGKEHGNKLNADHIKPFAFYPELRFAIDNGRTLCIECHKKTNTYGKNNTN